MLIYLKIFKKMINVIVYVCMCFAAEHADETAGNGWVCKCRQIVMNLVIRWLVGSDQLDEGSQIGRATELTID